MPIDRKKFYDSIRQSLFGGKITTSQVGGIDGILNEWDSHHSTENINWLSYMLATAYHEVDKTMQPIEEYGKGANKPYGKPDPKTGKAYYGRGLVQLTWLSNYKTFSRILGIDLVNHPELALQDDIAIQIMFTGMIKGLFTGVGLPKFINDKKTDFINARKIINSLDDASLIASYAEKFKQALS